ncbi:hypothetical protein [Lysobacter sp. CA196]|uniref:hypothetical protein n=1 Tax=Lysobacter sp. CA196 TaxID=3455606 RepID=UPI003F8D5920
MDRRMATHTTVTVGAAALALLLLAASSGEARAQDNAPLIDGVGAYTHSQIMRHRGDEAATPANKAGDKPAPTQRAGKRAPLGLDSLTFSPTPTVTKALNAAFADSLTGRRPTLDHATLRGIDAEFVRNPRFRESLARQLGGDRERVLLALQSGRLQAQFQRRLAEHGYSSRNLGDVINAFMIDGWTVVNDGARSDHGAAFAVLRQRLSDSLARGEPMTTMERSRMQEAAELYGLVATLAAAAWQNASSPAERASLRDGVNAIGHGIGIDFRRVALTDRGFAPRR